jgi:hypothetical protein
MVTKMYHLEIPLRLAVEADSVVEAKRLLRAVYEEAMAGLPVGAGVFMDDDEWGRRAKQIRWPVTAGEQAASDQA